MSEDLQYMVDCLQEHNNKAKELQLMTVLAPKCISELKMLDAEMGKVAAAFWKHVWNNPNHTIPKQYKYLMAFCAAIGSNRDHQAARELIKAYGEGATLAEISEAIEMIWNTESHFTCEMESSQVMKVYNKIKADTEQGVYRIQFHIKSKIIHIQQQERDCRSAATTDYQFEQEL